jgi:hypothetical protein
LPAILQPLPLVVLGVAQAGGGKRHVQLLLRGVEARLARTPA